MTILGGLIQNASFLLALVFAHSLFVERLPRGRLTTRLLSGALFGATAVVGMIYPVTLLPGVFFDARTVIVSMAGLFGGPAAGAVAALIAAGYRSWLGGAGAAMGVGTIVTAAVLGAAFHRLRQRGKVEIDIRTLAALGLVVHVLAMAWTAVLPAVARAQVLSQVALPFLVVLPSLGVLLGLLLRMQEQRIDAALALRESRARLDEAQRIARLGYWEWDLRADTHHWSKEIVALLGRDPTSPPARSPEVSGYFTADSWARLSAALDAARADGQAFECDAEVIRPDDSCRWATVRGEAVRERSGEIALLRGTMQDSTERKRVSDALARERGFLATLIQAIPDLVWLKDPDGVYLACNPRFERFFGATEARIKGRTDHDFVSSEQAALFRQHDLNALSAGGPTSNEETITFAADGHRERLETIKTPMHDADGRLIGILGIGRDIGPQHEAREALRRERDRIHAILETVEAFILALDLDGRIELINRKGCQTLGHTAEELRGKDWFEVSTPSGLSPSTARAAHQAALGADGEGSLPYQTSIRTRDGRERRISWRNSLLRDDAGQIIGTLSAGEDVTEREELHERIEKLAAHIPGVIYQYRQWPDGRAAFPYASRGIEAIYGVTPGEVVEDATPVFSAIHPADLARVTASIGESMKALATWHEQYRARLPDGRTIWVEGESSPERQADGSVLWHGYIRDVTERRQAEDDLRESRQKLLQAQYIARMGDFEWDVATGRVSWSDGMYRLLGYAPGEAIDLATVNAAIHHPEDGARVMQWLREAIASGAETLDSNEYRLIRKDGAVIHVQTDGWIVRTLDGATKVFGVCQDITGRKQAESEAQAMRAKLESALAAMSDAVFISDAAGNLVHVNEAFATFHRFASVQECAERLDAYPDILEVSLPDGSLAPLSQWAIPRALAGETAVDQEYRLRRKDTNESWVGSYNLAPIRDATGQIVGSVVTGRDITERKRAEGQRRHLQDMLARTERISRIGSWEWDLESGTVTWSDELFRLFRLDAGSGAPTYAEQASLFPPEDRERIDRAVAAAVDTGTAYELELQAIRPDGTRRVCLARGYPERRDDGRVVRLFGSMQDITEQQRAQTQLRLAANVFAHSIEGIIITDRNNRILDVNPSFTAVTGYTKEEAVGRDPKFLASGRHDKAFYSAMWQALEDDGFWHGEIWNRRKNGEVFPEMLSISTVRDPAGRLHNHIGVFADITEAKAHEAQLNHIANYDHLTGAANRRLLTERLDQAIAGTHRDGSALAVCYLDLDGFKPLNDRYGHAVGDEFLVRMTKALRQTLREGDTIARLGGDEFVLLLTGLARPEDCFGLLDRILARVREPIRVMDADHRVSASIGVTLCPPDVPDPDGLLRHADQAMYRAKETGGDAYHLYDAEQDRLLRVRRLRVDELWRAVREDELRLHFQPQVDLISRKVLGVEALLRWQHPDAGLLEPGDFLPDSEGTELEVAVGEWVLRNAMRQCEQWRRAGRRLRVSVNIGAYHLLRPDFTRRLGDLIAAHPGVGVGDLALEILETAALSDFEQAQRALADSQALGVRVALDDFGTGYSSLAYFRLLPLDVLKIDKSFVGDMLDDPCAMDIVRSVVQLSRAFDRSVIAEGVETLAHAALLTWLGCRSAQGCGIARPMPASALPEWLARWSGQNGWGDLDEGTQHEEIALMVAVQNHLFWLHSVVESNAQPGSSWPPCLEPGGSPFQRWYEGPAARRYGGRQAFREIGHSHARAQAAAERLLRSTDLLDTRGKDRSLRELHRASDDLIAGIKRLAAADTRLGQAIADGDPLSVIGVAPVGVPADGWRAGDGRLATYRTWP
ncbi:PAS domain S-box protein [Thiococcus pfennigii]|uniref:PAS domain S-box protein n=1 Tax=Thiococcus pfennigii TaxID=1057 RepID=UPI0019079B1C|nr:PAS domain S-box protein [Thiococcus pfennigii]MBK1700783.1 hypothetical protein [Thiococcus pfennigii]